MPVGRAAKTGPRWLTLTAAALEVDLSLRQLQGYTTRAGCPRKSNGKGGWLYQWPAFNRFVREELAGEARRAATPADLDEARARKMAAEAELAELELATARADLITVADAVKGADAVFDRVRARLVSVPGKAAHLFVGLKKLPDAIAALTDVVDGVLVELSGGGEAG